MEKKKTSYTNIRELTIGQATLVTGGAEEGCADRCYEGNGCDCQPAGSPDSGKAGYNLGLALSNWLMMP